MPTVAFVAPFYAETTLRFAAALASTPGVRCALVSQEPLERLEQPLRRRFGAHWQVTDTLDADQLVAACRGLGDTFGRVELITGILEQLQVPLALARARLGLPGMDPDTASNFRDKARMKTVLAQAGLPCARHCLAVERGQALEFAARVGFPIVFKPPAGAGARDTFRVDDEAAFWQALSLAAPDPGNPLLLEEFVVGREHSFECVLVDGQPVWHSFSHYLPTPLEVLRNPWIQWCVLLPREIDSPLFGRARAAGVEALLALGMHTGICHLEWFQRADGSLAISEVAARPPGAQITSMISYAHEMDLYRSWAELTAFGRFEPRPRLYAVGTVFLRGQGHGRVVAVHGLDAAQRELGHLVVEARLPRKGQTQASGYEGEGYVVLRHPETAVVEEGLRRVQQLVRVELAA